MGRDEERDQKPGRNRHHKRGKDSSDRSDDDDSESREGGHPGRHHHKKDRKHSRYRKRKHRDSHSKDREDEKRRHRKHQRKREHSRERTGSEEDESSSRHRHRKKASRHRDDRDDEDRRRKEERKSNDAHDKKEKKKRKEKRRNDDISSENERHHKKSKRNTKAPQRTDKTSLYPMGERLGKVPETLIDPENDYFTYHQEFWVYLYREEGVRFNDLKSEEARKAFVRFAKQYNAGKLETPYYDNPPSFPSQVLDESKTTQHKWAFQTTETERKGLEQLQEGVRRLTQYTEDGKTKDSLPQSRTDSSKTPNQGAHVDDVEYHQQRKTPEEMVEDRRRNRRFREHVRTAQEEITGGAKDFRDRQLEKKKLQSARIHGAAREKEEGGAGVEMSDAFVHGDGNRSFQDALARERHSKAKREEKRNARVEELQQKESERQENMLKMLGLAGVKPGQKIKIAPRKDG